MEITNHYKIGIVVSVAKRAESAGMLGYGKGSHVRERGIHEHGSSGEPMYGPASTITQQIRELKSRPV